jgi:hypothetical protein
MIFTLLPLGQGHPVNERSAAVENSEPSVATRIFICGLGSAFVFSCPGRTTSTEHGPRRKTERGVLPINCRSQGRSVLEPTMTRSACQSPANVLIARRGLPITISVVTFPPIPCRRPAASSKFWRIWALTRSNSSGVLANGYGFKTFSTQKYEPEGQGRAAAAFTTFSSGEAPSMASITFIWPPQSRELSSLPGTSTTGELTHLHG